MSAVTDLDRLVREMSPVLHPGEFVFVSVNDSSVAQSLEPICTFMESEGVTAICSHDRAVQANFRFDGVFRHLTLNVNSSLHAVGLIAAVADVLKRAGISCNVVSAFHHDHLFVPAERAEDALWLLKEMSRQTS